MQKLRLSIVAMFGVMMLSSCLFEPDPQETIEKPLNLNDLENWVVNGSVNKTAVDSFGYENCFRIVPISDDVWDDFTLYYQGDKEAVSRNDYSAVRQSRRRAALEGTRSGAQSVQSPHCRRPGRASVQGARLHLGR